MMKDVEGRRLHDILQPGGPRQKPLERCGKANDTKIFRVSRPSQNAFSYLTFCLPHISSTYTRCCQSSSYSNYRLLLQIDKSEHILYLLYQYTDAPQDNISSMNLFLPETLTKKNMPLINLLSFFPKYCN